MRRTTETHRVRGWHMIRHLLLCKLSLMLFGDLSIGSSGWALHVHMLRRGLVRTKLANHRPAHVEVKAAERTDVIVVVKPAHWHAR